MTNTKNYIRLGQLVAISLLLSIGINSLEAARLQDAQSLGVRDEPGNYVDDQVDVSAIWAAIQRNEAEQRESSVEVTTAATSTTTTTTSEKPTTLTASDIATERVEGTTISGTTNENEVPQPQRCPICLDSFDSVDDGSDAVELTTETPCRHRFHSACLEEWLSKLQRTTCPYCRSKIREGEDKDLGVQPILPPEFEELFNQQLEDARRRQEARQERRPPVPALGPLRGPLHHRRLAVITSDGRVSDDMTPQQIMELFERRERGQ